MKRWMLLLLASLALWGGAWAEDVGSSGDVRKLGPEESKALLKDVGLVIKDKPAYPNVAYRLYPKPYQVFELATVGYSPFEQEDGSPPNGMNPDDAKLWGPNGEPVVILRKPGDGMWMEGFFSRKRVPVEPTRYAYRYSKIPNDREDPGETVAGINFDKPKDESGGWLPLFYFHNELNGRTKINSLLSRFILRSSKEATIAELSQQADSFPYPLGMRIEKGRFNPLILCEPLVGFLARSTGARNKNQDSFLWGKAILSYVTPKPTTKRTPHGQANKHYCPESGWLAESGTPHLLPDGDTVLVPVGSHAVIRLRWEDGEPVGPLPPFIKVIDAQEVIWAKLDLLRRYRDEMKRRGIKDATKLRTPAQISHDLAAYFFDIQEISLI